MRKIFGIVLLVVFFVAAAIAAPPTHAGQPAPGFQCRATANDIGSRPGNPQIIEPIKATSNCHNVSYQSITVILQHWNPRGILRGRWEQVAKRTTSKRGPGLISVSTRWNCGDPHRNNAGRVKLRVVATGWAVDMDGDPGGASALSRNEITRDCAV